MMQAVFSIVYMYLLLSPLSGCVSHTNADQDDFFLGTWTGEFMSATSINGNRNENRIRIKITAQKDGTFEIEEESLSENRKTRHTCFYQFEEPNRLTISGYEEEFLVTKLKSDEIVFDLGKKDRWAESAPIWIGVRLKRSKVEPPASD